MGNKDKIQEKSYILVGNPDSGKSNFLARLWLALQTQKFKLIAAQPPSDIKYVEEIASHILHGQFVPRTDKEDNKRDFNVSVKSVDGNYEADIFIPDVSGEMWKKAVETWEIPGNWLKTIQVSSGALIFVRVLSDLNIQPLDWVNSQKFLKAGMTNDHDAQSVPTQTSLIELLRFLEENLIPGKDTRPKVAVIVSAWDLLNVEDAKNGPLSYLEEQFPMFAGRILDTQKLNIKLFGLSVVGGDLSIQSFMDAYLNKDTDNEGYVVSMNENEELERIEDITAPLDWLIN